MIQYDFENFKKWCVFLFSQDRHPMTFPMVAFATGFLGAMLGDLAALGCSTVDGSEIRRSPVDMVNIPLCTGFYTYQVVGNGISEPSTVSFYIILMILSLLLWIRCHINSHTRLFQKPQKYVISVFLWPLMITNLMRIKMDVDDRPYILKVLWCKNVLLVRTLLHACFWMESVHTYLEPRWYLIFIYIYIIHV